LELLSKIV
jgi:hypothetical protein